MAGDEEAVSKTATDSVWDRGTAYLGGLVTPWRLSAALTVFFFLLAFIVYDITSPGRINFTGPASLLEVFPAPGPSNFNHPLRLADAFLHGRLDVANAIELRHLDWAIYPKDDPNAKFYPLEPPGTALVVVTGVALYGLALNQTLVSIVIGALNISVVFSLMRRLAEKLSAAIWMTVLFAFGTIYWWNATNGGVWYFAHTVAVLFLFLAVYETLVGKRPFRAGLLLGAAYLTRLPTIMTFPFFLIMFAQEGLLSDAFGVVWRVVKERSLPFSEARALIKRDDVRSLARFAAGLTIVVVLLSLYNFIRFDTPLHASYTNWHVFCEEGSLFNNLCQEDLTAPGRLFGGDGLLGSGTNGLFDISYIPRHIPVLFEGLPYLTEEAPYIIFDWDGGPAFWATTPVFLFALFAGIQRARVRTVGWVALLAVLAVFVLLPAIGAGPTIGPALSWAQLDAPFGLPHFLGLAGLFGIDRTYFLLFHFLRLAPFLGLIALSIVAGFKNKLVLACWAAIIPVALIHFTAGVTGWPQFGYRYLLDYAPFVFLLAWVGMGQDLKWYHKALIVGSVAINFAGVLWINEFDPRGYLGLRWVNF